MRRVMVFVLVLMVPLAVLAGGEVKDPNPAVGNSGPLPRATGGPDGFGYVWHDQSEADVTFQWIDISGTGTALGSGDEQSFVQTLDFPFSFYGTTYNTLVASTNGYLSTDPTDSGGDLSNDCPLPAAPSTGGGARIYLLQDDLVVDGSIYYQYFATCPRPDHTGATPGCMVFEWNQVHHYGDNTTWDMEAVLYDQSNEIAVQIGAGNPELGAGSTTGIQNDGATIGLTYACDTANSVPDDTAVAFYVPGSSPTPAAPAVPAMTSWGLVAFLLTIAGVAVLLLRRRG